MRATILVTAALLSACTPESHQLLGDPDAGDGPRDCFDGADEDLHGLPCTFAGTCGGSDWWSGCVGGEHAMARLAAPSGRGVCDAPMDTQGASGDVQIVGVDGMCADVLHCGSGAMLSVCQAPGRVGLRTDAAPSPYLDCATATATARDGDPCAGALRCAGVRGGMSLVLWCDDAGVVRLLAADGVASVRP